MPEPAATLPLFPLRAVLMPAGLLALRIFEPRYLDMVKRCARGGSGFGVCLIVDGAEVGEPAVPAAVGTEARIVDFSAQEGGTLGIAVEGERRFAVRSRSVQPDGLVVADVRWLPPPPSTPVDPRHAFLVDLLKRMLERAGGPHALADRASFDDADWLSCRLAELLPLALGQRQRLLEEDDPQGRLDALLRWLPQLA